MNKPVIYSVGILGAATLLLESTLTRYLAVAQYYHFAFLVISLSLLGFGASGSLLSISQRLRNTPLNDLLAISSLGFSFTLAVTYLILNFLPFDSFSIAWDRRQFLLLGLYYLAMSLPFLLAGIGIGAAISAATVDSHIVYAANLIGSAAGVVIALGIGEIAGVSGAILACAILGLVGYMLFPRARASKTGKLVIVLLCLGLFVGGLLIGADSMQNSPLLMAISPYKQLSLQLQLPGARRIFGGWNAISRVDLLADVSTHKLPGLSYTVAIDLPEEYALTLDADETFAVPINADIGFRAAEYLPEHIAFQLQSLQNALILDLGGGLPIHQAVQGNTRQIEAIYENRLIIEALSKIPENAVLLNNPAVNYVRAPIRGYLAFSTERFAVIYLPLNDNFRPVTNGAYSLSENYHFTIEMFVQMINQLDENGIIVFSRWLQTPPSESLRALTTIAQALRLQGITEPDQVIIAYRSIQTMTYLIKPSGWNQDELIALREFTNSRKFDLVWLPDIQETEVNIHNKLPGPVYYQTFRAYLESDNPSKFIADYPYSISPPTDNRPFFFHFFKWEQTPEILASFGKTWQPFGGSGYFVLIILLGLVLAMSLFLIILPLVVARISNQRKTSQNKVSEISNDRNQMPRFQVEVLLYFALIGIGYLFVEIALFQKFILLFGYPAYSFAIVVATILLFSGLGSFFSHISSRVSTSVYIPLVLVVGFSPLVSQVVLNQALGWSLPGRILIVFVSLAPLAFFMGYPFPLGISCVEGINSKIIPWAWAVNGCASVVASVIAALIALDYGFNEVIWLGAVCYLGAMIIFILWSRRGWLNQSSIPGFNATKT